MKQTRYLLLLLLAASCASQRVAKHRSYEADVQPAAPTVQVVVAPPSPDKDAAPAQVQIQPSSLTQALDALCQSPLLQTTQLGLCVYDLTDDRPLYARGAAQRMRPASCQKVITAVTALHCLGGDYQLTTDLRITGQISGGTLTGDLYIVGGMDPMVTQADVDQAIGYLRNSVGIKRINGSVICDLSMREDKPLGQGWCWDDDYGPLSALMVSGKAEFDQCLKKALTKAGLQVGGSRSKTGQAPADARSVYAIRHSIDQLLEPMMKKSDNIYAECLFYQTAATSGRKWAGSKEAAARTAGLMQQLGLQADAYQVADGSGLSLYNYTSAEALVAFLRYAWQTPAIREHLLPSLPIAGVDGTLQKRMQGTPAAGNVRAKTGTVTGIVSLSGYLTARNGHTLAFSIINQGVSSSAQGRNFQDQVCNALCR